MTELDVITRIVRCLQPLPLPHSALVIIVREIPERPGDWSARVTTVDYQFSFNTEGDIFYLLTIEISKEHRGQGIGGCLYWCCEELARHLGAVTVAMSASGWCVVGDMADAIVGDDTCETRLAYLLRHGYEQGATRSTAQKTLLPLPHATADGPSYRYYKRAKPFFNDLAYIRVNTLTGKGEMVAKDGEAEPLQDADHVVALGQKDGEWLEIHEVQAKELVLTAIKKKRKKVGK